MKNGEHSIIPTNNNEKIAQIDKGTGEKANATGLMKEDNNRRVKHD